jgi:hypothetical protein
MRNGLWTKGFGIGMILLFLGMCVVANIRGNVVNANTTADIITNSTMQEKYTAIFIGFIKDMVKLDDNRYEFRFIRALCWGFHDGEYVGFIYIKGCNYLVYFIFETKIGFIGNHVICGVFTYFVYNS